eukprot:4353480-Prymnesium_polylepis.1
MHAPLHGTALGGWCTPAAHHLVNLHPGMIRPGPYNTGGGGPSGRMWTVRLLRLKASLICEDQ